MVWNGTFWLLKRFQVHDFRSKQEATLFDLDLVDLNLKNLKISWSLSTCFYMALGQWHVIAHLKSSVRTSSGFCNEGCIWNITLLIIILDPMAFQVFDMKSHGSRAPQWSVMLKCSVFPSAAEIFAPLPALLVCQIWVFAQGNGEHVLVTRLPEWPWINPKTYLWGSSPLSLWLMWNPWCSSNLRPSLHQKLCCSPSDPEKKTAAAVKLLPFKIYIA